MNDITSQTLTDLIKKIKDKKLSSEEVTKSFIDRAEKSKKLNCYITEDFESAIKKAKAFDNKPNFKTELISIFRNMIGGADNKDQPAYLSFEALNQLMQNMDMQQFDYDGFKQIYDANPELANLVKNFDEKGVCNICNKFSASSNRALAAHQRGCKKRSNETALFVQTEK